MSVLNITLTDTVRCRLQMQAERHGCTVEDEARSILEKSLAHEIDKQGLGSRICQRFRKIGGVELDLPNRSLPRLLNTPQETDAP